MDRILKLIYDNILPIKHRNEEILLNGVHPAVISYIKKFSNDVYEGKKSIPQLCDEIQSFNEDSS